MTMDLADPVMQLKKVVPHSLEAEQSVLGAMMLDNRAWERVEGRLSPEDFYVENHRLIFKSMVSLAKKNQPFDVLTVAEALKVTNTLAKVGGDPYLFQLANNTPTAANVEAYADIVRDKAVLRRLIETGTDITQSAFQSEGRDVKELLDDAERKVFNIASSETRGEGPVGISALLARATDRIDELYHAKGDITGVSSGFTDFDKMTSGLQAGDLVIVAGRPSMGKTVFGVNIAESVAMQTISDETVKPVLIFSLEMPSESIAMRMISSLGRIDQHRIRSGKLHEEDWPRLTSAVSMLSEAKLLVDDTPAISPGELRSRARRVAREYGGLSLIVVDYLQLMTVPGFRDNRTGEVSEISRSLKALAKELEIPVVALSQLNRSLEQRHDKRPVMSDLRESGAIEQDADLIAFIYRDEVYNEDSPDKGTAEIIIGKQRNGPIGKVRLTFLGQFTRFDNFMSNRVDTATPFE